VRLLDLVKPFLPILPEVQVPLQKVGYEEKLTWTVGTAILFFIMSEIPLYGVKSQESYDAL
jgi:protein transport protein SEC61 subunit alpha